MGIEQYSAASLSRGVMPISARSTTTPHFSDNVLSSHILHTFFATNIPTLYLTSGNFSLPASVSPFISGTDITSQPFFTAEGPTRAVVSGVVLSCCIEVTSWADNGPRPTSSPGVTRCHVTAGTVARDPTRYHVIAALSESCCRCVFISNSILQWKLGWKRKYPTAGIDPAAFSGLTGRRLIVQKG